MANEELEKKAAGIARRLKRAGKDYNFIYLTVEEATPIILAALDEATTTFMTDYLRLNGQIAERDGWIKELEADLSVAGELDAVKNAHIAELESRLHLIIDFGFDYDGFETADNLKSLIDNIVKVARGEEATDEK